MGKIVEMWLYDELPIMCPQTIMSVVVFTGRMKDAI